MINLREKLVSFLLFSNYWLFIAVYNCVINICIYPFLETWGRELMTPKRGRGQKTRDRAYGRLGWPPTMCSGGWAPPTLCPDGKPPPTLCSGHRLPLTSYPVAARRRRARQTSQSSVPVFGLCHGAGPSWVRGFERCSDLGPRVKFMAQH